MAESDPPEPRHVASNPLSPSSSKLALFRTAYEAWADHKSARLGAALAYYTVFSLAPLVLIAITVAGFFLGRDAATGAISGQIQATLGHQASQAVQDMVTHAAKPSRTILEGFIGVVTLLLGAAGVFGQLQDAMNTIWDVEVKSHGGLWALIKARFLSLTMVLGTCFLLLVSLVLSTALASLAHLFSRLIDVAIVLQVIDLVVSLATITVLFAFLFKYLPDTRISWHDVWLGGFLTAVLFVAGKFALGLYLGRPGAMSSYGAAGSLLVILLWVYYAAQIFFFGAEFTRAYANIFGSRVSARDDAVLAKST